MPVQSGLLLSTESSRLQTDATLNPLTGAAFPIAVRLPHRQAVPYCPQKYSAHLSQPDRYRSGAILLFPPVALAIVPFLPVHAAASPQKESWRVVVGACCVLGSAQTEECCHDDFGSTDFE